MAPRITRARAAATKADTKEAAPKKLGTTKVTKSAPTKKAKAAVEEPTADIVEEPKKTATRATKSTTKPTTLAAAPRRRLKVTPLDTPPSIEEPALELPKETSKTKKTTTATTRTKKATSKETTAQDAVSEEPQLPTKTRSRATKAPEKKPVEKAEPATRARGRPKRTAAVQAEEAIEEMADVAMPPTRKTRARSSSNAEPPTDTTVVATKPKTGVRKKVTFQDLPEDDKENQPVSSRRGAAKKATTPATGMRAKPVRKPAAAAVTKKTTTATKGKTSKATPRVLTPKKPTQINKQATPESEGEDELSGAKTPVRDLSLSPKRNAQLGARLSPVKKLDFSQKLPSPDRVLEPATLLSPARRPASMKDAGSTSPLKESPRRFEVAPVFPSAAEQSVNVAATLAPSLSQSVLQQSPKRVVLDPAAFSQSAMKPKNSSFKESLLKSPARRLFSPAKSRTPATSEKHLSAGTPEDVAVSSHFRSSVSPKRSGRVHRMSDEELAEELKDAIDFDQSILNVRSPLKIKRVEPQVLHNADTPMLDDDLLPALQEAMEPLESNVMDVERSISSVGSKEGREPSVDRDTSSNETDEDSSTIIAKASRPKMSGPRLSEILFRSARFGPADDSSSEDELAADMTPDRAPSLFRSSLTGATTRTRLSTVAPSNLSRDVGYTPLAAQMSGWLASSPEKKNIKKKEAVSPFSPVAAQHIDGEVQISRQSTPQQYKSPLAQVTSARSTRTRKSAASSVGPTPEKTSFFEEQMVSHDADVHMENSNEAPASEAVLAAEGEEMGVQHPVQEQQLETNTATPDDTVIIGEGNGELTTDLINFTNASDTAMADFATLAEEAEELAPPDSELQQSSSETSVYGDENIAPTENAIGISEPAAPELDVTDGANADATDNNEERASAMQQEHSASTVYQDEPGPSPSPPAHGSIAAITPVRPDPNASRYANTIVSKVPLRPEGDVSPIKVAKKRSRSLSTAGHNNAGSPPKRTQLTPVGKLVPRSLTDDGVFFSPDRRIRSAAPSPAHTTPGQTTFTADDFGDSTLDGLEVPEVEMEFDIGPPTATATPATTKSVKIARSAAPTPSRTPLKVMGGGVLHGAVVYVEVHTTEGADASGVYIDLLTQMGARCVRDWRWNPRTSLGGDESASPKVGISHVVYKDGGKRTLEKVRDAKGEVWCVGVRWVLE